MPALHHSVPYEGRERRRRYSSGSDDPSPRRDRGERRLSSHRRSKSRRPREDSRSDHRTRRHSRSHGDDRKERRRRDPSRSISPDHCLPSSRNDRRHSKRQYSRSRSPPPKRRRSHSRGDDRRSRHYDDRRNYSPPRRRSPSPPPPSKRSKAPLPSQAVAYNQNPTSSTLEKAPEAEKQKPNYAPTGKLAAETNTVANTSIVLKYNEPPEARIPPHSAQWRLYIFKGADLLETLPLHERSCWLFGRERAVVDFPTEHPSCSKQHAVLQFRYTEKKNEWGERKGGVKPFVIDLESANGTMVNGEKVPQRRYVEVRSEDVITLGESTREYVLMLPPKD